MRKSDLANVQYQINTLDQINQSSLDRFIEIFQSTFSAIATIDPDIAANLIDQLVSQKDGVLEAGVERDGQNKEFIALAMKGMPDVIHLDDEEEDQEDEE